MIKRELIKETAKETGFTQSEVEAMLNALLDTIRTELKAGGNISINQFGKFYPKEYSGRTITTPAGKEVNIQSSTTAGFKAGRYLKDYLNDRRA